MPWIQITTPTPVLNTPDFVSVFGGLCGSSIPLSPLGHPEQFEFVALTNMQFEILDQIGPHILQIHWPQYSTTPYFLDRRFGRIIDIPQSFAPPLFTKNSILNHMEKRVGTPYVWGGNWAQGIPEMMAYYPPKNHLTKHMYVLWTLQGLDCSGLLFEATDGATPRNTSHLLKYGRSLAPSEPLEPLDLIIYPGHVLFVRDSATIIESKSPFGVRICSLQARIDEISQHRRLVAEWDPILDHASHFTIRRSTQIL